MPRYDEYGDELDDDDVIPDHQQVRRDANDYAEFKAWQAERDAENAQRQLDQVAMSQAGGDEWRHRAQESAEGPDPRLVARRRADETVDAGGTEDDGLAVMANTIMAAAARGDKRVLLGKDGRPKG